jgi:xanthine/uracil permease
MRERAGRARATAGLGARRGLWGLARIVSLITSVVVGLIVIAIVLVLLEANRDNAIVDWLVGAGDDLTQPFHGVFQPDGRKAMVAVNWGLAAVVYALIGGFIARLLRR